jgi:hypothetical protein
LIVGVVCCMAIRQKPDGASHATAQTERQATSDIGYNLDDDPVFAVELCRETIAKNPNDAVAHFKSGRLLRIHMRRFEDAEAEYRMAIELDLKFAMPQTNLTIALAGRGQTEDSQMAAVRALLIGTK